MKNSGKMHLLKNFYIQKLLELSSFRLSFHYKDIAVNIQNRSTAVTSWNKTTVCHFSTK